MTIVGLARLGPDPLTDGVLAAIRGAALELGLVTRDVLQPAEEAGVDALLIVGYPRAYARFIDAPRQARRIAWFGEPLPRPARDGESIGRVRASLVGTSLGMLKRGVGPLTRRPLPGPLGQAREAALIGAERTANLADAIWCAGSVDRVVVTSRDRGRTLAQHQVPAIVVPFGYHPAGAGPLVPPDRDLRDIAVAVLGSGIGERRFRRGRLLAAIETALVGSGPLLRLEGVWGPDRDAVLARTKVVLDLHRIPGNFTGLRFLTTLAAGAVLATEPLDDPHPFVPGVDHVAAPADALAQAVEAILRDEPRRIALVRVGQSRLVGDVSMRASLERVLAA